MIPFHELVVGLRNNKFYLRWPRQRVEIIPRASHMLNPMSGPPLIRLLDVIGLDGRAFLTAFNWGGATDLPFLPRIQVGRFILSLAQWRITPYLRDRGLSVTSPEGFHSSLPAWRERWQIPRYVYLSNVDSRLLLDLADPQQSDELRLELQKLEEGAALLLQEVFPTLDQAWVQGPGGHYLTEFVVPLSRRATAMEHTGDARTVEISGLEWATNLTTLLSATSPQRLKALGSEWVFMKLYCGKDMQEELIAGPLRNFARDALKRELAEDWFFLRYADPDPHIRLRFRGDSPRLISTFLPILCDWGTWLIAKGSCLKYTFDTYDREVERYGGLAGLDLAETIFCADSRAVADLLALTQAHPLPLDRKLLAVLSIDELLTALGLNGQARLAWAHQRIMDRHQSGQTYRQHSGQLRTLLGNPAQALAALPGGSEVRAILARCHEVLAPIAIRLAELDAQQALGKPLTTLYASYIHLHCNRLLNTDSIAEEEVLGLLLRTYEGLKHTPVA